MGGVLALASLSGISAFFTSCSTVSPGNRGVLSTLGKVHEDAAPEGLVWKKPFGLTRLKEISVRQQTDEIPKAECYSSDLQQLNVKVRVLWRTPETSVVGLYRDYDGEPFAKLVEPRVLEALKESTATRTAEDIAKNREFVKKSTLDAARTKVGGILEIADIVIEDIALSTPLKDAIEMKMVKEQQAQQARFSQQKAVVDARTRIIEAFGTAEAMVIRGFTLSENPDYVKFLMAKKWDGKPPQVVGNASAPNVLIPMKE